MEEKEIVAFLGAKPHEREEILKARGVDAETCVKLAHSGRNGIIRYHLRGGLNSFTPTVHSQLACPPVTVTSVNTFSEPTVYMTPTTQVLASNPMVTTKMFRRN